MKANITIITEPSDDEVKDYGNFIANDVVCVLEELKKPIRLVCVNDYYHDTQEEKKEIIKSVLSLFNDDNCAITISAYISTKEFPQSEYKIMESDDNRKLVPVEEILDRESKMLEELGFLNINNYVKYEYKRAYIYSNEIGREVKAYFDNILDEQEKRNESEQ